MKQAVLLKCRQALLAKQEELSPRILRRDSIFIEQVADEMENVTNTADRDLAVRNLGADVNLLRMIIQALARLDRDEFGICQECEEPISDKRLYSVPWTLYCTACAEQKEGQRCISGLFLFGSLHTLQSQPTNGVRNGSVTNLPQQAPPPRPEPDDVFHRIACQNIYRGGVYPAESYYLLREQQRTKRK